MLKVIKNLSNIAVSIFLWAVTALMTFAVFIFCVVAIAVAFPFDRKRKLVHTAGFWWADAIIGVNPFWGFRMKGRENIDYKKTYVLISNHQSMADIVMVYKTRMQFKWVAKDKLFRIPVFGWCMRMMKYINLERGEHGSIRQAYEKAGEWLRSGVSVLFFPEGTRSNSEEMNPFKNGAFKLAIKE